MNYFPIYIQHYSEKVSKQHFTAEISFQIIDEFVALML